MGSQNDPDNWTNQMWIIPEEARLERDGKQWYIDVMMGYRIPIEAKWGEKLVEIVAERQERAEREYRNSPEFKAMREEYLRKKNESK